MRLLEEKLHTCPCAVTANSLHLLLSAFVQLINALTNSQFPASTHNAPQHCRWRDQGDSGLWVCKKPWRWGHDGASKQSCGQGGQERVDTGQWPKAPRPALHHKRLHPHHHLMRNIAIGCFSLTSAFSFHALRSVLRCGKQLLARRACSKPGQGQFIPKGSTSASSSASCQEDPPVKVVKPSDLLGS